VQKLEPPDRHYVEAAHGWLALDCAGEARKELQKVCPALQNHPLTLVIRWMLATREKNWDDALAVARQELEANPADLNGWLHRAYALRRRTGGGLAQAWDALLPAAKKFPQAPIVAYNLSCYACQLNQLDISRLWLRRAIQIGGKAFVKKNALADADLMPLWPEIQGL